MCGPLLTVLSQYSPLEKNVAYPALKGQGRARVNNVRKLTHT